MKTSKRVLVTGSDGQLGLTINELYSNNKADINFTFASKKELNISNHEEVKSFFSINKFDYCINCAAYTNVEQAEKNPKIAFDVNTEAVKNLAVICRDFNVILIHISTDYVFDGESEEHYKEYDLTNPINIYGKSKLAGEKWIQKTLITYFIIRTSWLYSRYGNNFYTSICKIANLKDEISIITDQKGSPTSCKDLARVILELINKKESSYGLYHYSNEGITSWYEFARTIFRKKNIKTKILKIKSENYPSIVKRPTNTVLDKKKIKAILNNEIPTWQDSLDIMIKNDK
jgi:dTDP-4-dehydrorhamnose reductase